MPVSSTESWIHKACTAPVLSEDALPQPKPDADSTSITLARSKLLWDNGTTIKYFFLGGTDTQQKKIDIAVLELEFFANVTICPTEDINEAQIRISFKDDENAASWSMLGKEALEITDVNLPTMNLDTIDPSTAKLSSVEKAKILHQFGHVLGLVHEHPDPTKKGGCLLDTAATYELYSKSLGIPEDHIKSKVLDIYNAGPISNYPRVDTSSIMRFPIPAQLQSEGKDITFGSRLSDLDRAYLCIVYPRDEPHTLAPQWTQEFALDVMGVTGGPKTSLLETSSVETRRYQFALWVAMRTFRA